MRAKNDSRFVRPIQRRCASLGLLVAIAIASPARAETASELTLVEFNSDFLQGTGQKIDTTRFARGNPVLPGSYMVDLAVNGQWIARTMVDFITMTSGAGAAPCIDSAILSRIETDLAALPAATRVGLESARCADLTGTIAGASVEFDQSALRLSISLPQAMLRRKARGFVKPESWQKGVPSVTLAYDTSVFRVESSGTNAISVYAGLTGGMNLGNWHIRERGSLSGTNGSWRYQNVAAYLQRDLPGIKSALTIGDTFSDGAVFDSFGFRGIMLASDDRMRPESQQGYAPIVRGTARTNARVRITQNGTLLLETAVSPGPFEIDDLYPTGYGGDLLVTVLEADGTQQSFTVSYASLVGLLRPRVLRYSIAAGDLTLNGKRSSGHFFQGTLQYGATNNLTAYAGVAVASGYASGLIGAAFNTPLGAIALDATVAEAHITPLNVDQGYSVRLSYSKVVPGILTNVSVAAYRHSSSGFWAMDDAMAARQASGTGEVAMRFIQRQRDRIAANISQNLGGAWGNLYLNGSITSYWDEVGSRLQVQAGYSNVARLGDLNLNYGLSYGRQRNDATRRTEDRLLLSLSLALNRGLNAPRVTANLVNDRSQGHSQTGAQISLAGTLGAGQEFNYNANLNLDQGKAAFGIGAGYRAPFAMLSASASRSAAFNQFSFGASGGLVVHPGGVTLANQLGDTVGLVEAPGAKGAAVSAASGARVDGAGYAVVPYLVPYRLNEIDLDPRELALDVELKNTRQQVAPRANAVVMLKYETVSGQGVLITGRLPDGSPVPFGADVLDETRAQIGIVGQDGQIFLRAIPDAGALVVQWGPSDDSRCRLSYRLPSSRKGNPPIVKLDAVCRSNVSDTILAEPEPHITALPV